MSSILVYIDHFGGKTKPVSLEITGKARELGVIILDQTQLMELLQS